MFRPTTSVSAHRFVSKFTYHLILGVAALVLGFATAQTSRAATINVPAGGDFQAALNNAQPGDEIVLAAGASYTGPFTLPVKSGSSYITVRSSAMTSLPGPNVRLTPSYAAAMPKLVSPGQGSPALMTAPMAHHFQFVGIEIKPVNAAAILYDLVWLGDGSTAQSSLSQVPHHFIFDRCWVHGDAGGQIKRGIALNSSSTTIVNSYFSDIKNTGQDAQAICGWNGPGPFTINNNYIEASGNIVMFGGADAAIQNLIPSDIEFRNNYVSRPVAWRDVYRIKNLFELKNAQRVTIDGNIFENNWASAQNGFAILFTVRNEYGGAPWNVVQNITFTNNIVRHSASGINVLGTDYLYPSQLSNHMTIKNNLLYDISTSWGGSGTFFQIAGGTYITVDHNTAFQNGPILTGTGTTAPNFTFTNNIAAHNDYGIFGDSVGIGNTAINYYWPGGTFLKNVIAMNTGVSSSLYPANNFYPASLAPSMFMNYAAGNYRLASGSPYHNAGTNGTDVGANLDALDAATAGAGGTPTSTPTPTPTITPTPTPTVTPTPTPTVTPTPTPSGTTMLSDDFNDNVRDAVKWVVTTVQGMVNGPSGWDQTIPVREQNQRLEITPLENVAGDKYNGYVLTNSANLTNARATVEVKQVANGVPADTQLALCVDSQNFYMIVQETGLLYFQQVVGGVRTGVNVTYDPVAHRIWRIRHNATNDTIVWETSGDGVNWHQQRTVARQLPLTSMRAEISAGTWRATTTPGTAIFDNFMLESNVPITTVTSPQMVADAITQLNTLLQTRSPSRAAVQSFAANLQQAYATFTAESSRFASPTAIDFDLSTSVGIAKLAAVTPTAMVNKRLLQIVKYLADASTQMQSQVAGRSDGVASNSMPPNTRVPVGLDAFWQPSDRHYSS